MFHFKGFFQIENCYLHLLYRRLKAKTDLAFLDLNYIGNMYYLVLTKSYAQYLLSSLSAKSYTILSGKRPIFPWKTWKTPGI